MAYDSENIFARILRGEIPCFKIFEDEHTLSFLDIMPAITGHSLVIPKQPAETMFDLSPEGLAATIRTTQLVAAAVKTAFDAPGLMLVQLNGPASGQSVPHLHFHILPRFHGLDMGFHGRQMADLSTLEPVAQRIRAAL